MRKEKILIVDDALIMRVMLRGILENNGFHSLEEARDKQEAVEKYKTTRPDLVFMDLVLEPEIELSGIEAIKEIFKFDPNAKIIVVSAIEQKKILGEAFLLGIKNYINKPFDEIQVSTAIEKLLGAE